MEYPSISVCLSVEEIEKLESTCKQYSENAQQLCLNPITIREVFEKRSEEKHQFFQRMVERSRANLERWTDEQNEMALVLAEKKKKLLEELSAQLEDVRERKIVERQNSVEMELKYLREAKKMDELLMIKDNINLRKRIEYYQELHNTINEKQREKASQNKLSLVIPSSVALQPSPRTPAGSTAGTDFESCFGEDDQTSEYEECISEGFIDKFNQNEGEINEIVNANENSTENTSCLENFNTPIGQEFKDPQIEDDNIAVSYIGIKRSVSDVINSNEVTTQHKDGILQQNRQKAMSGVNMSHCVKTLEVDIQNDTIIAEGIESLHKNNANEICEYV